MRIGMLGAGFIADFYTMALHGKRARDRVTVVWSRTRESAERFARRWNVPHVASGMSEAIEHDQVDVVIVGLPNHLHHDAVLAAAAAGKPVLCTKPLGRTAAEAWEMLMAVEQAGVFAGYLEDLVYTPKTLKAIKSVRGGAIGDVLWVRSRETHPGPHSAWFWDRRFSGGGVLVDMGCHCIEIGRCFIGKDIRPVEVVCWTDTQVHPIETEDHAIGLVRYANGAVGQFEVSWVFRGGLDLRDEVAGTEGTIWLNHWLRTGMEIFSSAGESDYVAEKSESSTGWLFPVGDEASALGYLDMFEDMLGAVEQGTLPGETFYDGYVVNAIIDAAYRSADSRKWESVELQEWRGRDQVENVTAHLDFDDDHLLVKREQMPDGSTRVILRNRHSGEITQRTL
jgi:predicted dehydrogenase